LGAFITSFHAGNLFLMLLTIPFNYWKFSSAKLRKFQPASERKVVSGFGTKAVLVVPLTK
jgi:hypothetical protein